MVKERLIGSYSPSKSSSKGSVALCQEEEKIFTNARMVAGKDDTLNPMKVERFIMAMSTERPYREVKQKIIGGAQTMVGRIFRDRDAQNLRRIKQRKGHCFIQASSDDEDDKDDEYDSGFFHDRDAQKMYRINQRKRAWLYSGNK